MQNHQKISRDGEFETLLDVLASIDQAPPKFRNWREAVLFTMLRSMGSARYAIPFWTGTLALLVIAAVTDHNGQDISSELLMAAFGCFIVLGFSVWKDPVFNMFLPACLLALLPSLLGFSDTTVAFYWAFATAPIYLTVWLSALIPHCSRPLR